MDGQTLYVPRVDLNKIRAVNDQLTKETGLTIEEVMYSKMIPRDVNNYIGVYEDNTREHEHLKLKGCFEIDKEYHKDPSARIVPIALKEYFVYGKPIEETIRNHTNIFDFCLRLKTNSKSIPYYESAKEKIKLNRTTRYYVSKTGGILYKDFGDGRVSGINVNYVNTIFNKYEKKDIKDYNINYLFYIEKANKIRYAIEGNTLQLTLFDEY